MLRIANAQQARGAIDTDRESVPCNRRRNFLKLAALSLGGLALPPALAKPMSGERVLYVYSPHIGTTLRQVYWTPREGYIEESVREISWLLRDHRNDESMSFDFRLLDLIYSAQVLMEYRDPIHVLCGYRSPATNAMLRLRSRAVAKDSYHMYARAMDIRMPGRQVSELRRSALAMDAGGVGYYPRSNFVHIDSGPVRRW